MAAGAAHIHGSLAHPQTDRALELALAEVEAGAAEWHRADRVVPERAQATWAKLGDRITRAIPLYAKRAPEVLDGWRVDGVELVLPSGSRLDLAGATVEGDTIADLKCKLTANDTMRGRLRWEFAVSPQLRHYVWEYSRLVAREVDHYYILLCTLEPFTLEAWRYPCPEETIQQWLGSTGQVWADMQAVAEGTRIPVMNPESCVRPWGRCPMWEACHTFRWDEGLMAVHGGYVR